MQWYEASARKGNRHAMSNLAVLYASGDADAQRNLAEAARWFERSAMLGYLDAQFNLAVLFERGDGVPQSLLDAYKWYAIAAEAGDSVAKTRANAIATQFSPEELQAAQQAVAHFVPQPVDHAANEIPTMAQVLVSG
ncbi:MAG: tetratricopeptide repeat protein, partial [Rhizomicrobium sp.]